MLTEAMSVADTLGSKVPSLIWFLTPLFPEFLGSAAVEAGLASPSEGLGCAGKASEICPQGALWTRARDTAAAAGLGGTPTRLIPPVGSGALQSTQTQEREKRTPDFKGIPRNVRTTGSRAETGSGPHGVTCVHQGTLCGI